MKVKCPHCNSMNNVKIKCGKCEKSFDDSEYTPAGSSTGALVACTVLLGTGALAGHAVDALTEQNRFPVQAEYMMLNTCVEQKPLPSYRASDRLKVCSCALEKTMNDVSSINDDAFSGIFRKNLYKCG